MGDAVALQVLLASVEESVSALEQDVDAARRGGGSPPKGSHHVEDRAQPGVTRWTFDNPPRPQRNGCKDDGATGASPRSTNRRKAAQVKAPDQVPGAGAYFPNFDAVLKQPPGVRMVAPPTHRDHRGDLAREPQRRKLDPDAAFRFTSGFRKIKGGAFAPPRETVVRKTNKCSESGKTTGKGGSGTSPSMYSYNPNLGAISRRTPGFVFGPPKAIDIAINERYDNARRPLEREDGEDQTPLEPLKLEQSYKAVEPRVKGVAAWAPPTGRTTSHAADAGLGTKISTDRISEDCDEEPLDDVGLAWKQTSTRVRGVVAWVPDVDKPGLEKRRTMETTRSDKVETRAAAKATSKPVGAKSEPLPSAGLAPATKKPKQLLQKLALERQAAARRGPGQYTTCSNTLSNTKTAVVMTKPSKTSKRLSNAKFEGPDMLTYDVLGAWEATQRKRPSVGVPMAMASARWKAPKSNAVNEHTVRDAKPQHADALGLPVLEASRSETTPRKRRERYRLENKEDDVHLSSASSWWTSSDSGESFSSEGEEGKDDTGLEQLAQWIKGVKDRKRREYLCASSKAHTPVVNDSSVWARKPFEETADARRQLILRRHRMKKKDEARGSDRVLHVNYNTTEQRQDRGIVRMDQAEATRRKQQELNAAIQAKVAAISKSKEIKLLEKLGIDSDLLREPAQRDEEPFKTNKNPKGVFRYHPPTELGSPAHRAAKLRAEEASALGPGTYATQRHTDWEDQDEEARRVSDALHEALQEADPVALADAKAQFEQLRKRQKMARTQGRERLRIRGKNLIEKIEFGNAAVLATGDELNPALGPGAYQVSDKVSRFGVDRVQVPMFDRMSQAPRFPQSDRDELNNEQQLDLDPPRAKDTLQVHAPGTRGFAFSTLPKEANDAQDDSKDKDREVLDPNYEFGKFKEPGKGLVPMDMVLGREPGDMMSEAVFKDPFGGAQRGDEVLALSPDRGLRFLQGPVKTIDMSKGGTRGLSADDDQENVTHDDFALPHGDMDAPPDISMTRDQSNTQVPDLSRGGPRWTQDEAHSLARDADYDVERGLATVWPRPAVALVDMSRGSPRLKEHEVEVFQDAIYPGAERDLGAILGGKNAKGQPRKGTASLKRTVDMSKGSRRKMLEQDAKEDDQEVLFLEPKCGDKHVKPRQQKGIVGMDQLPSRWSAQERAERRRQRELPASPEPDLVDLARAKLSIQEPSRRPNPKGHMDMKKWLGREQPQVHRVEADGVEAAGEHRESLEIDPAKGRDAPSQNKRVVGGFIGKAKRMDSPKTRYAREKSQQGNVLELDPRSDFLEPRSDVLEVRMDRMIGRSDLENVQRGNRDEEMMTSPVKTDLVRGLNALKPGIRGGAVGLGPVASKPVLEKQRRQEAEQQVEERRAISAAAVSQRIRARIERRAQLAKLAVEDEAPPLQQTARPRDVRPRLKGGKPIPRARKVF